MTVSDANDNPPIFTEVLYTADLPSSSNPGYNVKQVVARDADDGLNGQVTYSLQEPASIISGTFTIDTETGRQCMQRAHSHSSRATVLQGTHVCMSLEMKSP